MRSLLRRRDSHPPAQAPEPAIIGEGDYRLFDLYRPHGGAPIRLYPSLTDAMGAGGGVDANLWRIDSDQLIVRRATAGGSNGVWAIKGPGVGTGLEALAGKQIAALAARLKAEAAERDARWARWEKQVAEQKAKAAADEAAKPKPVISYLTRAGEALGNADLAVEVVTQPGYNTSTDHTETVATCKACGESHTVEWNGTGWDYDRWLEDRFDADGKLSTPRAREWAQNHAGECSAMPAPN